MMSNGPMQGGGENDAFRLALKALGLLAGVLNIVSAVFVMVDGGGGGGNNNDSTSTSTSSTSTSTVGTTSGGGGGGGGGGAGIGDGLSNNSFQKIMIMIPMIAFGGLGIFAIEAIDSSFGETLAFADPFLSPFKSRIYRTAYYILVGAPMGGMGGRGISLFALIACAFVGIMNGLCLLMKPFGEEEGPGEGGLAMKDAELGDDSTARSILQGLGILAGVLGVLNGALLFLYDFPNSFTTNTMQLACMAVAMILFSGVVPIANELIYMAPDQASLLLGVFGLRLPRGIYLAAVCMPISFMAPALPGLAIGVVQGLVGIINIVYSFSDDAAMGGGGGMGGGYPQKGPQTSQNPGFDQGYANNGGGKMAPYSTNGGMQQQQQPYSTNGGMQQQQAPYSANPGMQQQQQPYSTNGQYVNAQPGPYSTGGGGYGGQPQQGASPFGGGPQSQASPFGGQQQQQQQGWNQPPQPSGQF